MVIIVFQRTGKRGKPRAYGDVCVVQDCEKPHFRKGLCSTHHGRYERHGDPLVYLRTKKPKPPSPLKTVNCAICGMTFKQKAKNHIYCDRLCKDRAQVPSERKRERRRTRRRSGHISFPYICERDGWKCHICGQKVDPGLKWPDKMSATRDHVVPLAEGGDHTNENIKLAHRRCNEKRGARGGNEQLLLT